MDRYLKSLVIKDLQSKIVLIMGPRQCGKTTLAKALNPDCDYFNYDAEPDRLILKEQSWDRNKSLIIFDELHKMTGWKQWLKGIYDTQGIPPQLLVTGSAKLDVFRKVGDSLAGRYFQYRMHPIDLKEAKQFIGGDVDALFEQLWHCSGFPEPFLKNNPTYYRRWQRSHLEIILRQDVLDLTAVRDIFALETLVELLKDRVGSTVSYANLARNIERDANTVKRWLELLENLYVIYRVTPYHKNIARALLKEPKYYFYDHAQVSNVGARLENIVANALLKELHFIQDTTGKNIDLHFVRTKEGHEIDFLICIDRVPTHLIEVKTTDDEPARSFHHFQPYFPAVQQIQLVKTLKREKTFPNGLQIRRVAKWLAELDLDS